MELKRLQDRIDASEDGEVVVKRYGMWGTSAEVENCDGKYEVVHPNGKREKYRSLGDCELRLAELVK